MRTMDLTCATPGCSNEGHTIRLDVMDEVDAYLCGACGQPITDARVAS